jgi:hypothetical protein
LERKAHGEDSVTGKSRENSFSVGHRAVRERWPEPKLDPESSVLLFILATMVVGRAAGSKRPERDLNTA